MIFSQFRDRLSCVNPFNAKLAITIRQDLEVTNLSCTRAVTGQDELVPELVRRY